jgi:hypothetical protein
VGGFFPAPLPQLFFYRLRVRVVVCCMKPETNFLNFPEEFED